MLVGISVGTLVGISVGTLVGISVGMLVGACVGCTLPLYTSSGITMSLIVVVSV